MKTVNIYIYEHTLGWEELSRELYFVLLISYLKSHSHTHTNVHANTHTHKHMKIFVQKKSPIILTIIIIIAHFLLSIVIKKALKLFLEALLFRVIFKDDGQLVVTCKLVVIV